MEFTKTDSDFLAYLRGLSIFVIVFGHVGGFWVLRPYSEFLHVFVPMFFFISGALALRSLQHSTIIDYYKKRFVSLLIPYYLLCIISILVYIITNHHIPAFNMDNFIKWLEIRPSNDIMPFPIGQVWFLNTLFFITLLAPLYYLLWKGNRFVLLVVMICLILLSGLQLYPGVQSHFIFTPLIHSSFFILGMIVFSYQKLSNITLSFLFFIMSVTIKQIFSLNPDYAFHLFPPDLYYITGSMAAIFMAVTLKKQLVLFVNLNRIIKYLFLFLHKHTFSIFLLHTFAIYLSEIMFGLINYGNKTITYGITKFVIVLILTGTMAPFFTKLSETISRMVLLRLRTLNSLNSVHREDIVR